MVQENTSIRERFKEIRRLKGGARSTVYLAHDTSCVSFYREVVIKIVPTGAGGIPNQTLQRWRRELRTIASLRHPNIVQYMDIGEEDGEAGYFHYVVMEVVSGADLQQILDSQGFLMEEQTVAIAMGVVHALVVAHAAGVLHRDLKPSNVMVTMSTLHVKVIDFGMSKQLDNSSLISRIYTPMYFSPEQASDNNAADARTDVWAVGVLIFHCLTGSLPFGKLGDSMDIIIGAIRTARVPDLVKASQGRASEALRQVVEKALQRDLDRRTPTASELLRQLEVVIRAGLSRRLTSGPPH
mmetsp:Transcript_57855/g.152193  ORF Transcript_57855/g.152193 Transcript_57855/m.152193 type:complete len:297 (-) Transcript_57855:22-912(-)